MTPEILTLPLGALTLEPTLQIRARICPLTVRQYAERLAEGDRFPPVLAFREPETGTLRLADGFHRFRAAERAGHGELRVEVRLGDRRTALLHAVEANAEHGLPRSNEDKRRAVAALLADPEWGQWSDHELARRARVSQPFVSKLRHALSDNDYQMTERKARRNGDEYTLRTPTPRVRTPRTPAAPPPAPPSAARGSCRSPPSRKG